MGQYLYRPTMHHTGMKGRPGEVGGQAERGGKRSHLVAKLLRKPQVLDSMEHAKSPHHPHALSATEKTGKTHRDTREGALMPSLLPPSLLPSIHPHYLPLPASPLLEPPHSLFKPSPDVVQHNIFTGTLFSKCSPLHPAKKGQLTWKPQVEGGGGGER